MCYHWVVTERNSRIYPTSTVASKLARLESSWLQCVGHIAREGVQNTHQWSGQTEKAIENGVGQTGSCRHCGSHLSVASLIGPDQWCVFCTPSVAIIPKCCNQLDSNLANLRPQLSWDNFWSLRILQQIFQETIYQISSQSTEIYRIHYKEHFGLRTQCS